MQAKSRHKITINLLPKKRSSISEKFVFWLLSIGRYIIIGTELVVFGVFITRFQLDTRLSDLHDKIKQEEAIVKSLENVDKNARLLQTRLSEIKTLENVQTDQPNEFLLHITSLAPETVSFETIAKQKEKVSITAVSGSNRGFSLFVSNLRASPKLRDVHIIDIAKDEGTGLVRFGLVANQVTNDTKNAPL